MELNELISQTIKQITDVLIEGSQYIREKCSGSEGVRDDYTRVNFDVAVTTNEGKKAK